jgi:hypothetical protein
MADLLIDATAKGTIVTYNCPVLNITTVFSGTGMSDWQAVDDVEAAQIEVSTDGTLVSSVKPAFVKGTLTLLHNSPSLSVIQGIMARQYSTNLIFKGTLTLTSYSGLWTVKYDNFIWTSAYKGPELADKVKDVPLKWSAAVPTTINLSNVTAALSTLTSFL